MIRTAEDYISSLRDDEDYTIGDGKGS